MFIALAPGVEKIHAKILVELNCFISDLVSSFIQKIQINSSLALNSLYLSDPRREIESDESSSLVQKLMEGSMVITAQEDNKKEMPIIQSNQSSGISDD